MIALPLPPEEMRILVGPVDSDVFDNPSGASVFPEAGERGHGAVLDFGCGCGRLARQLIQQQPQPSRYLGIDLHAGMVAWCHQNLVPHAPQFEFSHHDIFNAGFNPGEHRPDVLPFPGDDDAFDLVIAHSVFTHVLEPAALHYINECARVLKPDGMIVATWFLFDKRLFPMLQRTQNALYINADDPTNAVIFDRNWLYSALDGAGLVIGAAEPPTIRGHQWRLMLYPSASGWAPVELPEDVAPLGSLPPPEPTTPPALVGRPRWRTARDAHTTIEEYIHSLEEARATADTYARSLELARENSEAYAKSLEEELQRERRS